MPTFQLTDVFKQTAQAYDAGKRRCLHEGGTSSSKTYSILQFLIMVAQGTKKPMLISVVSESLPHLKRGCIRDYFNILGESQDDNPHWSKTEFVYHWPLCDFEFFGADDASKVRGPRREILFINEGNNVAWETARGLDIRTSAFTLVDWNPVGSFWAHDNWIGQPENVYVHSTYLDAVDVLPQSVKDNIESNKDKDPNWWNIYGLGLIGKVEGLVYPNFQQVDALPAGLVFYGLDFGFLVDPTALVANVLLGDKLYSKELLYEAGLTNDHIARNMDLLHIREDRKEVWADPDEPKSIEEILRTGINIQGSVKGPGSVEYSHQKVNQCYQFWTKDSVNCIKEQRNFRYIRNKDGILTDKTTHQFSHGMSARRYAIAGHRPLSQITHTKRSPSTVF